jgi:membrane complex biogenesis BtpA family protein
MIHLPPLPGSVLYDGEGLGAATTSALRDAQVLLDAGVSGIEVENYGDMSYFPDTAPPESVAALTLVAGEIRKQFPAAVMGICLLSDPIGSLAIAHAVQAQFIRATFFTEAAVDVSGLVLRRPHEILRYRKFLDPSIKLFADVHIKHSAPLAQRPIEESAYDAAYFLADAVIVSGKHTGSATSLEELRLVRSALPEFPLFVGSGLTEDTVDELLDIADGGIVGTSLKLGGKTTNEVDPERVRMLLERVNRRRECVTGAPTS